MTTHSKLDTLHWRRISQFTCSHLSLMSCFCRKVRYCLFSVRNPFGNVCKYNGKISVISIYQIQHISLTRSGASEQPIYHQIHGLCSCREVLAGLSRDMEFMFHPLVNKYKHIMNSLWFEHFCKTTHVQTYTYSISD